MFCSDTHQFQQSYHGILVVVVESLSRVRLFATPWTVAHQAPPSMGFSSSHKSEREDSLRTAVERYTWDMGDQGTQRGTVFWIVQLDKTLDDSLWYTDHQSSRIRFRGGAVCGPWVHIFVLLLFLISWPHLSICRILVPKPGIELTPPAVEALSFNHWTTREVHEFSFRHGELKCLWDTQPRRGKRI